MPGDGRRSSPAAHADSHPTCTAAKKRPAGTSWPPLRSTQGRAPLLRRPMPTQRRIPMTLTGKSRTNSSNVALRAVSADDPLQAPWPAILERLPEYEPDNLLLSLDLYRESVLRRVVDDHGHVKVSRVGVAQVARGLPAGVSLPGRSLPRG